MGSINMNKTITTNGICHYCNKYWMLIQKYNNINDNIDEMNCFEDKKIIQIIECDCDKINNILSHINNILFILFTTYSNYNISYHEIIKKIEYYIEIYQSMIIKQNINKDIINNSDKIILLLKNIINNEIINIDINEIINNMNLRKKLKNIYISLKDIENNIKWTMINLR